MRLWFSGSKSMIAAISAGGSLHRFELKAKAHTVVFKWPLSIISTLSGLHVLRLAASSDLFIEEWLYITSTELSALPRSIIDLELDFEDKLVDSDVPLLPPNLTRLVLPRSRFLTTSGIKAMPRSLLTLDISQIKLFEARDLPPGLTRLKCAADWDLVFGSLFPPSICCLTLTEGAVISAESLKHASKELFSLKIHGSSYHTDFSPNWLPECSSFFSYLISLDLRNVSLDSEQIFSLLPAALLKLRLGWDLKTPPKFSDSISAMLPRQLLSFVLMPKYYELDQKKRFPKSIMDFPRANGLTQNFVDFLPQTLTKLHVWVLNLPIDINTSSRVQYGICADIYRKLPPKLTDLNIGLPSSCYPTNPFSYQDESFSTASQYSYPCASSTLAPGCLVPASAAKIVIRRVDSLAFFPGWEKYESLPNIRRMQIQHDQMDWRDLRPDWYIVCLRAFDSPGVFRPSRLTHIRGRFPRAGKFLKYLPRTVTFLEMQEGSLKNEHVRHLPDGLKFLLVAASHMLDDDCIPSLPHSLEVLRLEKSPNITLAPHHFKLPQSLRFLHIDGISSSPSLPSHLTIFHSASRIISDQVISYLPRTVTALRLTGTRKLSGSCFSKLPLNLLTLELLSVHMVTNNITDLPRSLRTLAIHKGVQNLSDSEVQALPPKLTSLTLSGAQFTNDTLKLLPAQLITLVLTQPKFLGIECIRYLPASLKRLWLQDWLPLAEILAIRPDLWVVRVPLEYRLE